MAYMVCRFHSSVLQRMTKAYVFLPDTHAVHDDTNKRQYPVMWLLHGLFSGAQDWFTRTEAERYAAGTGVALVMPELENSCGLNMQFGDSFCDFVAKELPKVLGASLPLCRDRESNWVTGVGYSGYGAALMAAIHPEQFSAACSITGVTPDDFDCIQSLSPGYKACMLGVNGCMTGTTLDILKQPPCHEDKPIHLICLNRREASFDKQQYNAQLMAHGYEVTNVSLNLSTGADALQPGIRMAISLMGMAIN